MMYHGMYHDIRYHSMHVNIGMTQSPSILLLDPFGLDLENLRQGGLSKSCVSVKVPAEPLSLEVLIQHLHTLEKKLGLSLAQLPSAGTVYFDLNPRRLAVDCLVN